MKAVYEQSTKNHELEFRLVQLTTIREAYLQDFHDLERAVTEKRRKFDDKSILDGMKLLNNIREISLDFLDQVAEWQKMFTKCKRPTIMNCDYLTEMIRSTEFVNSSPIRKHFNFAVMRRNIFMLPLSTGKPKDTVATTAEMIIEIDKFANPDLDRVISCYRLFQKSFPKKVFESLMPLDRWANNVWQPNVESYAKLPRIAQIPHPSSPQGSGKNNLQSTCTASTRKQAPSKQLPITSKRGGLSKAADAQALVSACNSVSGVLSESAASDTGASASVAAGLVGATRLDIIRNQEKFPTEQSNQDLNSTSATRPPMQSGTDRLGDPDKLVDSQSTPSQPTAKTKPAQKPPLKPLLSVDTAVAHAMAEGTLVHSTPAESGSPGLSGLAQTSALTSPGKSILSAGTPGIKHNRASKVFSEPSVFSTCGGDTTDGEPGGFMSTAQLREWYQAHAPQRQDESDDD